MKSVVMTLNQRNEKGCNQYGKTNRFGLDCTFNDALLIIGSIAQMLCFIALYYGVINCVPPL